MKEASDGNYLERCFDENKRHLNIFSLLSENVKVKHSGFFEFRRALIPYNTEFARRFLLRNSADREPLGRRMEARSTRCAGEKKFLHPFLVRLRGKEKGLLGDWTVAGRS